MVDSFIEDQEERFRRHLWKIPLEDVDNVEVLRTRMLEELDTSLRLGLISEAQYRHTKEMLMKYNLPGALWNYSKIFHLARLGLLPEEEPEIERWIELPLKEALSATNPLDRLLELGFTLDDINRLVRLGYVRLVENYVIPTDVAFRRVREMPEIPG